MFRKPLFKISRYGGSTNYPKKFKFSTTSKNDNFSWKTFAISTLVSGIITFGSVYLRKQLYHNEKIDQDGSSKELVAEGVLELAKYKPISLPPKQLIQNTEATECFKSILKSSYTGVIVVGAPSGVGKSSYLRKACEELSANNELRKSIYICHGLDVKFLEHLGVPSFAQISDFLPEGSIIVFDKIDITEDLFSADMKQFIIKLATQSSNSGKFQVIMLVSDPKVFEEILKLNGGEKILPAFSSTVFKWNKDQMLQLLEAYVPNWPTALKNEFVLEYANGKSAGLLKAAIDRYQKQPNGKVDKSHAKSSCQAKRKSWKDFENIY